MAPSTLLAALLWAGLLPERASAQTSGAAFLGISPSVRAYGMGMASGLTALGAEAVGSNAANLGRMPRRFDAYTSYATLMDSGRYEHLAAAFAPASRLVGLDALGLSVTRLENGGIPGADASGNPNGSSYGSADTAVALSGSGSPAHGLRLGLTAKLVQSQIAGYSSKPAPAGDLGLAYAVPGLARGVTLGASVTNLGPGVRFLSQTDKLPTALNGGAAVSVGPALLVLEVQRLVSARSTQFGMGLEYALGPVFFRSGYLAQNQSGNLALQDKGGAARMLASGMTAGVGLKMGAVKFDYAFGSSAVDYGMTQRIAFSVAWGERSAASYRPSHRDIRQPWGDDGF